MIINLRYLLLTCVQLPLWNLKKKKCSTRLSSRQTIHINFRGLEKWSTYAAWNVSFHVNSSLWNFRYRCTTESLPRSILGQEETLEKRGPFDSSPFSRSEIREKARRRIARASLETFTKSLFQTVRYDPWCIRSCSFIFYSVAITPDSKSRQSCARQLRDPKTFP